MKTPMQEFLEWLENSSNVKNDILNWEIVKENALQKEKEQIEISYTQGTYNLYVCDEDYYNQIYKK